MGFLHTFRIKKKSKKHDLTEAEVLPASQWPVALAPNPTSHWPVSLLIKVLSFVCPHVLDDSFCTSESSALDVDCTLCDLKDLGHCALVNHQWLEATRDLL